MKKEGSLKIILSVLVIVLLALISLGGIYVKHLNTMKNKLPNYKYGMEIDDTNIIKLQVSKNEKDSSGSAKENEEEKTNVASEEATEEEKSEVSAENEKNVENVENSTEKNEKNVENAENSTEKNVQASESENIYTADNYKKSKKMIEKRLKVVGIDQYTLRLDENTGDMVVELPTNVMSGVVQSIFNPGKLEIKISDTNEVIATNSNITSVETGIDNSYANYGYGSFVKLDIKFNKEATNKFTEIKNTNELTTTSEDGDIKDRNIAIYIDGSSLCSLTMEEFLKTAIEGTLPLTLGSYTTDTETLNSSLVQANLTKSLMENEEMPIKYEFTYTGMVKSNISKTNLVIVLSIIVAIMAIFIIAKYKLEGIFGALSIVGLICSILLLIRFTNIVVTISSIVALASIMFLQCLFVIKVLNNKQVNSKAFNTGIIEMTKMLIPAFIISLTISFAKIIELSTFGQVIFWGIILFEIFNNIITRAMLTNVKNK